MIKYSRNNIVDIKECITQMGGNQFDMILVAAARAREMVEQQRFNTFSNTTVDALLEIQQGKIAKDKYISKVV